MNTSSNLDIQLKKIKVTLPNGRKLFSIPELTIPFGRHVLIQGESGRGKTTFLHLLAGLFSPTEGKVKVGHIELNSLNDNQLCEMRLKQMGVIFQKLNLLDHLTVAENISLSCPSSNEDIQRAIDRVNLKNRGHERCSYLSLGEQQRVAVARVLAQAPQIILADEPTSSLDNKNCEFILSALKEVAKGKTLIVVSHDQRIQSYFDQVISFEDFV